MSNCVLQVIAEAALGVYPYCDPGVSSLCGTLRSPVADVVQIVGVEVGLLFGIFWMLSRIRCVDVCW